VPLAPVNDGLPKSSIPACPALYHGEWPWIGGAKARHDAIHRKMPPQPHGYTAGRSTVDARQPNSPGRSKAESPASSEAKTLEDAGSSGHTWRQTGARCVAECEWWPTVGETGGGHIWEHWSNEVGSRAQEHQYSPPPCTLSRGRLAIHSCAKNEGCFRRLFGGAPRQQRIVRIVHAGDTHWSWRAGFSTRDGARERTHGSHAAHTRTCTRSTRLARSVPYFPICAVSL